MSTRGWHRYWLGPVFVGLLLAPAPWGALVAVTAGVAVTGWRIARAIAARRARSRAVRGAAVVLGTDPRGRPVVLTDHELSAHGLVLGASGAGKSTTLLRILTEQIAHGRPVVAIDMKGSPAFAQVLAGASAAAGRPFASWSLDGPAHWNPLQHGNATELKDKLMATERFTEPHYQRAAERYVQMVLTVVARARPGRAPVLDEVVELMDPNRLPRALRGVDRDLRDRVRDYLSGMTSDQLSAVRGLQTRLAVLTESHTAPYLAPAPDGAGAAAGGAAAGGAAAGGAAAPGGAGVTIDLREALRGPQVVLFSLNSSRYGRLASQIGTLVVQDLVSASGDRLSDARPGRAVDLAMVGIDEFSALGADHVIALLSRGRESGMSVVLATQELADLDRAAVGLRDQVIGVTALKIVHRQEVPHSARMIAQMIGTERVWEVTRQTAGRLFGGYDTGRGTRREVERFTVHPNEIQSLRTGEAIVLSKLGDEGPQRVRVAPPRWDEPARPEQPPRQAEPPRTAELPVRVEPRTPEPPNASRPDSTRSRSSPPVQPPERSRSSPTPTPTPAPAPRRPPRDVGGR